MPGRVGLAPTGKNVDDATNHNNTKGFTRDGCAPPDTRGVCDLSAAVVNYNREEHRLSMRRTGSSSGSSGKYRPDVDGLRAIAVVAVILFHARLKAVAGGYIGVDVFYVISGYLITQFVDQRITAGRFTILEFYERRARRIIPALFFLLIAASLAALLSLLPVDLVSFAKSEIATVALVPNVFFYVNAGYFDSGARLKPLLHMWSLGVEEQFYIFFPPLMLVLSRWRSLGTKRVIGSVAAASLGLSVWMVQYRGESDAAFYLMPFRAWELLLGALLALRAFPTVRSRLLRNVLAGFGLGAILISAVAFSSTTSFPGLSAVIPCLGAALIIYADESGPTLTGSLLSVRPLVWVGLISYSLYLWHWPTLVLAEQMRGRVLSPVQTIACVIFSVAAAALSWRFVEQPFRNKTATVTRRALMVQAGVGAVALVGAGLALAVLDGVPRRFPPTALAYAYSHYGRDQNLDPCRTPEQIQQAPGCHLGNAQVSTPSFLLWGDSHAAALAPAFEAAAEKSGIAGWITYKPACMPLLDVERVGTPGCPQFNRNVLAIIERDDIPTVMLAGRWALAALGLTSRELDDGQSQVFFSDSSSTARSLGENAAVFARGLHRLLAHPAMLGRNVVLVIDLPDTGIDTPRYLARSVIWGDVTNPSQDVRIAMSSYTQASTRVDDQLARIAAEHHAVTIDPKTVLCRNAQCLIARTGRSLYRDSHHLTVFGALQLENLFQPVLALSATHRQSSHPDGSAPARSTYGPADSFRNGDNLY